MRIARKNIFALFFVAPLALAAAPLSSACPNEHSKVLESGASIKSDAHACCAQKGKMRIATAPELCQNCFVEAATSAGTVKEQAGELSLATALQSTWEIIPEIIEHTPSPVEQIANSALPPLYLLQQKILV